MKLKSAIIIAICVGISVYAIQFLLKGISIYQIGNTASACMTELQYENQVASAKSKSEQLEIAKQLFECIQPKIGFPASMLFNMDEFIQNIEAEQSTAEKPTS